jgi:hypothetical protein
MVELSEHVGLIGRLSAGKDTFAKQHGYLQIGFADPIYDMLGSSDKSLPGVRESLQKIGQWGRGYVSVSYPLSIERRLFGEWVKYQYLPFAQHWELDPESWGTPDFWLHAGIARARRLRKAALTNIRFANEAVAAAEADFDIVLVLCSDFDELAERQSRACGGDTTRLVDVSEQLALDLTAFHSHGFAARVREGLPKLRAIVDTAKNPRKLENPEGLPIIFSP